MPSTQAVGLEQVGGVTHSSKGHVANADTRAQSGKTLNNVSDSTNGRMVGGAGDLMRGAMVNAAAASVKAALHGGDIGVSFAQGEKHVVQGTIDSAQQQKVSVTDAETTYDMLSKPINA
jgi:hypothetical protein